jgi:hypothetical protein
LTEKVLSASFQGLAAAGFRLYLATGSPLECDTKIHGSVGKKTLSKGSLINGAAREQRVARSGTGQFEATPIMSYGPEKVIGSELMANRNTGVKPRDRKSKVDSGLLSRSTGIEGVEPARRPHVEEALLCAELAMLPHLEFSRRRNKDPQLLARISLMAVMKLAVSPKAAKAVEAAQRLERSVMLGWSGKVPVFNFPKMDPGVMLRLEELRLRIKEYKRILAALPLLTLLSWRLHNPQALEKAHRMEHIARFGGGFPVVACPVVRGRPVARQNVSSFRAA